MHSNGRYLQGGVVPDPTPPQLSHPPTQVNIELSQAYRLLLSWEQSYRQLIWLRVAPDLSVSIGTGERVTGVDFSARRRASPDPLPDGIVTRLGHNPTGSDFHFTFHTSGVINAPGMPRTYRKPHSTPGLHEFCAIDFKHPLKLRRVETRKRDIPVRWDPPSHGAIRGILLATPGDTVGFFEEPAFQSPLLLRLPDDGPGANLFLQFSLLIQSAPWPEDSKVVFVSQDPEQRGP
jgi:hypothetical protein